MKAYLTLTSWQSKPQLSQDVALLGNAFEFGLQASPPRSVRPALSFIAGTL
jgi:hypothetical protein